MPESGKPPQIVLLELTQGLMVAKALQVAAELDIAGALSRGPRTAGELAQAAGAHGPSLYRLLRALASRGIFREDAEGRFHNTALSEPLRGGVPGSVRDYVIYAPNDGNMLSWMRLMDVVKTGQPSFRDATGFEAWDYFREHPEAGECFNRAMTSLSANVAELLVATYDFGGFRSIVDIAGGHGLLLARVLKDYPQLRGVLFEMPEVAETARAYFKHEGLADRSETVAGSIFETIPAGHDAYMMKHILHDWSDADALRILSACRKAIPSHGKLIVLDAVLSPGNEPHPAKWVDLHMMVALGGRERTEEELRAMFEASGFRHTRTILLPAPIGIVEAVPV